MRQVPSYSSSARHIQSQLGHTHIRETDCCVVGADLYCNITSRISPSIYIYIYGINSFTYFCHGFEFQCIIASFWFFLCLTCLFCSVIILCFQSLLFGPLSPSESTTEACFTQTLFTDLFNSFLVNTS